MALLQRLRTERQQQQRKPPFPRSTFANISALVKEFGLGEDFLSRLDSFRDYLTKESLEDAGVRPKGQLQPPLFSLSTETEYQVTKAIMARVNNPYLHFARSPEEIMLCEPLFKRNPGLTPDKLADYHFETLLLYEFAREEVKDLTQQVKEASPEDDPSRLSFLQKRLLKLRLFLANTKNLESTSG